MATYPRTQNKILALTKLMIAGYSEHPGDFPSADIAALQTAQNQYQAASEALDQAQSAATIAAADKTEKLKQLQTVTKAQLKKSQVDTGDCPEKLTQIGWSPKADPKSMQEPSQPGDLKITAQGTGGENNDKGILHLSWKKSMFKRARFVRLYSIERRLASAQQTDPNSQWRHITFALDNKIALKAEPVGLRLQYQVRAVNKGGQSFPSNTVSVVL